MAAGRKPGPQGIESHAVSTTARHSSRSLTVTRGHLTAPTALVRETTHFLQPSLGTKLLAVELTMGNLKPYIGPSLDHSFRMAVAKLAEGFVPRNLSSPADHRFTRSFEATAEFFDTRARDIYESLNLVPIASLPNADMSLLLDAYPDHIPLKSLRHCKTIALSRGDAVVEFGITLTKLVFAIVHYLAAYLYQSGLSDLRIPLASPDSKRLSADLIAGCIATLRHTGLPNPFFEWIHSNWSALLSAPLFAPDPGHMTTQAREVVPEDLDRHRQDDTADADPADDPTRPILTYIEIHVIDEDGNPVNRGRYRLELTDGSIRKGALPQDGRIRVDSIPAGTCDFKLFQMLDFGVAEEEVTRSWDWREPSAANLPKEVLAAQHSAAEIDEPHLTSKE